jgi:hypothetical protein
MKKNSISERDQKIFRREKQIMIDLITYTLEFPLKKVEKFDARKIISLNNF